MLAIARRIATESREEDGIGRDGRICDLERRERGDRTIAERRFARLRRDEIGDVAARRIALIEQLLRANECGIDACDGRANDGGFGTGGDLERRT